MALTNELQHKLTIKPSSDSRHRQDKTVLSCSCRRCEQNWRQVKTVFNSPHRISRLDKKVWKFSVADSADLSTQTLVCVGGVNWALVVWLTVCSDVESWTLQCWKPIYSISNLQQHTTYVSLHSTAMDTVKHRLVLQYKLSLKVKIILFLVKCRHLPSHLSNLVVQWRSGEALDLRSIGRGFNFHWDSTA